MFWSTTQVNNEGHEEEAYDGDDFDRGEDEFGLAIDGDGEDVEAYNDSKDD